MKKIFALLILLYIVFFGAQFIFNYFRTSHEVFYNVNNVEIKEYYQGNTKNEKENYYFELTTASNTFYIQTFSNLNKNKKVITDIKYYSDEQYECLLPIFKNDIVLTDMICINSGIMNNYQNIKDDNVTEYLKTINEYN